MTGVYDDFQEGQRRLRAGRPAQATVPLEKARRRAPDKASIREALGIAYFRLGRYEEAEAEFRAVLDISPVNDYARVAAAHLAPGGTFACVFPVEQLARVTRAGPNSLAGEFAGA